MPAPGSGMIAGPAPQMQVPWHRYLVAGSVAALGTGLLFFESNVRWFEAGFSAAIMRITGAGHAQAVGSNVIFPQDHHWIGYTIAASCTAALLIFPFFLIAAALMVFGRVQAWGAIKALLAVSAVLWLANQARLFVIGESMRVWGFDKGYSRSHILAGGFISTLGVGVGIAAFVALLLHERSANRVRATQQ